jgi:peptidoglycan/LPS O-acetylase OafA/YrhL
LTSFGDILSKHKGAGPGFDLLRIGLALMIVYVHAYAIAPHEVTPVTSMAIQHTLDAPSGFGSALYGGLRQIKAIATFYSTETRFIETLVPMFFALSGFLVTGSAFRTKSVSTFLSFRILRILPALFMEVALCALVLGPAMTSFPLGQYFTNPLFFSYFGNIVGHIHFLLPGLFLSNPIPLVNGNLWTLPSEFYCYLFIALMMVTRTLYMKIPFTAAFAVISVFMFWHNPQLRDVSNPVYCFFCGVFLFHWKDRIPFHWSLILISLVVTYSQMLTTPSFYVYPIFLSYLTMCLGLTKFPFTDILKGRDYSYGIYLYGWPITQAVLWTLPWMKGHGFWLFTAAAPLVFLFAAFSWHLIEKPTLSLKSIVAKRFNADRRLVAPNAVPTES